MNLDELTQKKEGLYFEAKSASKSVPADFWETYSSFANTFGGTVVFGMTEDDNRELIVTGVEDPEQTVKTLWDNLNSPRFVNVNILKNDDIRIEEINGKNVIVITVPPADRQFRPIYIRNNINSGTFKRNHEGDYHCRMSEIKEMIRDSETNSQDTEPVESLNLDCLNKDTISRYLNSLKARKMNHPWTEESLENFLSLSGSARQINGVSHPTLSGLLMFGNVACIRSALPGYFLDYRETVAGERYTYRLHSNSGEWSGNIFDFVSEVMNRINIRLGVPFELDGFSNKGESETFKAVREAILNALIHADYHMSRGIVIELRPECIRISNPGTMRVRIDDALKGGYSDPRNVTLMSLAMSVGWVERIGSGIYTIEKALKDDRISSFTIDEQTDPSSVNVEIGISLKGTGKHSNKARDANKLRILQMIAENPSISQETMGMELSVSLKTVGTLLKELKEDGVLIREGKTKGGRWIIVDKDSNRNQ
ncbi:MAG: putative DNA binding domain-containing protein [Candidatus Methanomethylophilaceae archaeon]|nr:putative DNA binding domain-containing protein [Candidatus Methanomethylophilaceae archaeon]